MLVLKEKRLSYPFRLCYAILKGIAQTIRNLGNWCKLKKQELFLFSVSPLECLLYVKETSPVFFGRKIIPQ